MNPYIKPSALLLGLMAVSVSCGESGLSGDTAVSSCMQCHNGDVSGTYAGPGLPNPHPFPGADKITCVFCHGGDNKGADKVTSHVPPPPEIGDRANQLQNRTAWFNRLTLTGIDKFPDYTVAGKKYTGIDYLQFVNPGDLRVAKANRACGSCHTGHSEKVWGGILATETGILSGGMFAVGVQNMVPANRLKFEDTAADVAFRGVLDTQFAFNPNLVGLVGELIEFPVFSKRQKGTNQIFRNPNYLANALAADIDGNNKIKDGSKLSHLLYEQIAFTCGDCHLGSAGANNRYGDFRSSGCTACHMPYSPDGRSYSKDPNVNKLEPLDPDDIDPPERAHIKEHRIRSVKKTLSNGEQLEGIGDLACAGCHQGSNRTVMQYWGIRLDQNQDVRRGFQYPVGPAKFTNTRNDTRLFDPVVGNRTFNGRNANQYLEFEDYDGDLRDDTPPDVHHEAGLGCIDCHGSYDLHGGDVNDTKSNIVSRMEQAVAITCQSCHGSATSYAATKTGTAIDGVQRELAMDRKGNVLKHVYKDAQGYYYLIGKLDGKTHYVSQTMDTIVDNGRINTISKKKVYTPKASYAMGRNDTLPATGIGPQQTAMANNGFSHMDNMKCSTCHSSWTNTCTGCHLVGEYNEGNNFSNITGERIAFREKDAQFVYQSPVPFGMGVGADNKIQTFSTATKMFFAYEDINNTRSNFMGFSDRKGQGNKPAVLGAMGHNGMMAHSIRGRVSKTMEGPRYCVSCHLTTKAITDYGPAYNTFRTALATNNFAAVDFNLLKVEIGQNPGNQRNSPFFVHMAAGLGTGLFLFDQNGFPVNPLDTNPNRANNLAQKSPKDIFNLANVRYNLDRIVGTTGVSMASNNHPMLDPTQTLNLRTGSLDPKMAGPLGSALIQKLTDPVNGLVLNSWITADGTLGGGAGAFVK